MHHPFWSNAPGAENKKATRHQVACLHFRHSNGAAHPAKAFAVANVEMLFSLSTPRLAAATSSVAALLMLKCNVTDSRANFYSTEVPIAPTIHLSAMRTARPSVLDLTTMTALASIALALGFALGGSPAKTPARSVRVGDFLVTARHVWIPVSSAKASTRFHSVVVEVTVKNVSRRISHTELLPWLRVNPYEEYLGESCSGLSPCGGGLKALELYQMLPGEQSTGGIIFTSVRNGTTPVALVFIHYAGGREFKPSVSLAGLTENQPAR